MLNARVRDIDTVKPKNTKTRRALVVSHTLPLTFYFIMPNNFHS